MKKILGCILIALSSTCFASAKGFYIGAGLGPQMADFSQDSTIINPGNLNVSDKTHLAAKGVFGTLFGGYAFDLDHYCQKCKSIYLAAELDANYSTADFYSSNKNYDHHNFTSSQYKMQRMYGISVIPGYIFSDSTLFYARLGFEKGNFELYTSDESLKNINKYLDGFRYGLGIKQELSQKLAVRVEYSQVSYQSTSSYYVGNVAKNTVISPETFQVEFGLVYNIS